MISQSRTTSTGLWVTNYVESYCLTPAYSLTHTPWSMMYDLSVTNYIFEAISHERVTNAYCLIHKPTTTCHDPTSTILHVPICSILQLPISSKFPYSPSSHIHHSPCSHMLHSPTSNILQNPIFSIIPYPPFSMFPYASSSMIPYSPFSMFPYSLSHIRLCVTNHVYELNRLSHTYWLTRRS